MHIRVNTLLNDQTEVAISSEGIDAVRLGFNPHENPQVDALKAMAAALISACADMKQQQPACARHASLAITAFEEGAMWAVKAATTGT